MNLSLLPLAATALSAALLGTPALAQPFFVDSTSAWLPQEAMPENGMDVEAADLDLDGDLDIVIANEFQRNTILLNDGAGHFTNATSRLPNVGHDSEDIAIADFDGDGDPDIVFVSEDDNVHEYFLNRGDGRFDTTRARLPQSVANAVTAADFTGDGYPDLVIGNAGQDFLLVNDKEGYLLDETAARLPEETHVTQDVELVDIDRDGDLDLVCANEDGNTLALNDGSGRFTDATSERLPIDATMESRKVTVVDVNGDTHPDLFFSNVGWRSGFDPQDRLYINDGTGHFTDLTHALLPPDDETSLDAKFSDVDGDGDLDYVSGNFQGRPVTAFLNDGNGAFTEATESFFGEAPTGDILGIELADLNGDRIPDLYLCDRGHRDKVFMGTRGEGAVGSADDRDAGATLRLAITNAANGTGAIRLVYAIPMRGAAAITAFDARGARVAVLDSAVAAPSEGELTWSTDGLPSGLYYLRLECAGRASVVSVVIGE